MQVGEWMTKSVLTVKPQDTLRHARELMAKHRINQLPVIMNGKLVGIVTDRDIRDAYPSSLRLFRGKDVDDFGETHHVEDVMTFNVLTVDQDTSIHEAAQRMRRERFGALPVVENDDKLVGIITRSDVLDAMLTASNPSEA